MSDPASAGDADRQPTHETVAEILAIEGMEADHFVAAGGARNHMGTIYGGRLLAQSLLAASRTVDVLPVASLHAYFLAPGQVDAPINYRVVRLRDSRRFANRQVTAMQGDRAIFTLMAEFHAPEPGFAHQIAAMPDVPAPEATPSVQHYVRAHHASVHPAAVENFSGATPVEIRPVGPDGYFRGRSRLPRAFWFRLPPGGDAVDRRGQACLLAYGSDYWLAGVAAIPHTFPTNRRELMIASLDHAMWFHRPFDPGDWMLHHTVSMSAGDGLGLAQGRIFDRHGVLIATTTQECLLRRVCSEE